MLVGFLANGPDRYNPQSRSVLLEYLDTQLKNGTYDALPNLAILKLYVPNQVGTKDEAFVSVVSVVDSRPTRAGRLVISLSLIHI